MIFSGSFQQEELPNFFVEHELHQVFRILLIEKISIKGHWNSKFKNPDLLIWGYHIATISASGVLFHKTSTGNFNRLEFYESSAMNIFKLSLDEIVEDRINPLIIEFSQPQYLTHEIPFIRDFTKRLVLE